MLASKVWNIFSSQVDCCGIAIFRNLGLLKMSQLRHLNILHSVPGSLGTKQPSCRYLLHSRYCTNGGAIVALAFLLGKAPSLFEIFSVNEVSYLLNGWHDTICTMETKRWLAQSLQDLAYFYGNSNATKNWRVNSSHPARVNLSGAKW